LQVRKCRALCSSAQLKSNQVKLVSVLVLLLKLPVQGKTACPGEKHISAMNHEEAINLLWFPKHFLSF
jgi:hypothetical protein